MKRHASEQDLNDVYCCAMHPPPGAKRDLDGQLEGRVLSGASEIRIGSTQSTRKVTNLLEGGSSPAVRLRAGEPDPEDVAALVAAELNSLSLEQRKEIYDDLHGVTMHREVETPETIDRWLREFKDAIRKIRYKPEYEKAAFLNPDFVLDPKIALMFLRAEDYNAKRAARRIVTHYKHKMELFGVDKLARPITFDDLDEDDKNAALTGFYQRFHLPDQSGRSVIISFPHLLNFKTAINQVCLAFSGTNNLVPTFSLVRILFP